MLHGARPQRILLPVNVWFVTLTLAVALAFNLLPWNDMTGLPDMLALVLTFWAVQQPRKVSVEVGFVLGLVMDVGNGTLMGQHALAYAVLTFVANALSRRLLWFQPRHQALHVLFLLLGCQVVMLIARMIAGSGFPGLLYFLGSFIGAALWPAAVAVLLAPQRRPESVDENRPI